MNDRELSYLAGYASRLRDAGGDLTVLTKNESRHLALLLEKDALEDEEELLEQAVESGINPP